MTEEQSIWQPLLELPRVGKVLLAVYAPTNWAYWVQTAVFTCNDTARMREQRLKYARAWMWCPPPPVLDDVAVESDT